MLNRSNLELVMKNVRQEVESIMSTKSPKQKRSSSLGSVINNSDHSSNGNSNEIYTNLWSDYQYFRRVFEDDQIDG